MTAPQLIKAAAERKSVTGLPWGKPTPANVVEHMIFRDVMRWLPRLQIYKPKNKGKK